MLGLCKHRGAHVTAVVRAHHADRARDLGADVVVDADAEDFTATETPYDVCIDIAGSVTMARGLAAVRPGGTYVVIGGPTDDPWFGPVFRPLLWMLRGLFARQRVKVFVSKPSRQSLETLAALVDEGAITPLYDSACALSELPGAVVALDEGRRRGKVLVAVVSDHQTAPQPIS